MLKRTCDRKIAYDTCSDRKVADDTCCDRKIADDTCSDRKIAYDGKAIRRSLERERERERERQRKVAPFSRKIASTLLLTSAILLDDEDVIT